MGSSRFPTGSVTFLLTDIEGSTRLIEELSEEGYARALAEHRRLLRAAFSAHGGVEVDTQGDAFLYAFADPAEALAAAGQAQAALAAGPVKVRMGLHTGEPLLTGEGYTGRELHRAARIAASGHGGQVVVSAATRALVDGELRELGEHRLKDFDEPVALFQLGRERFPPLKTISNTNLPRPASSFVGRQRECDELVSMLSEGTRLLTLSGPGGSGKTRLALEAATELVPSFKAGVFWVSLSALRDQALVTETIAQTLGAKNGLADHIVDRELLLLLDNFEQVVEAAPELADLLEVCPRLTLVVTSREVLRVRGEVEYAVPPLAEAEAIELFCARSQLERSDEIAELCRRLDNLPLAVELAAARTRVLRPSQILERLSDRLDLLKGGRDAEARQQTLRAAIEWSHDLLTDEEQQLFARISVFAGGFTLESVEEVCNADIDTLESLADKNLIRFADARFSMLEAVREFARERLEQSPSAGDVKSRHARRFLKLAEDADAQLRGPGQAAWLDRLEQELGNLRVALARAIESADPTTALRSAAALEVFWDLRGHYSEGRRWLEGALTESTQTSGAIRAKAQKVAAVLAWRQGDLGRALTLVEDAIQLCRDVEDPGTLAECLYTLGAVRYLNGDLAGATAIYRESEVLAHKTGNDYLLALLTHARGITAMSGGNYGEASSYFGQALALGREIGALDVVVNALLDSGFVALHDGRPAEAAASFEEALAENEQLGWKEVVAYCLLGFAAIATADGASTEGATLLGASGVARETIGLKSLEAYADRIAHRTEDLLRGALPENDLAKALADGRAMTASEATAYALNALRHGWSEG